jgi:hypothetical protein
MENATKRHYDDVSRIMIEKFIAACSCQLDRRQTSKPDDVRPIISSFNSRGQVDLIKMAANPDPPYTWIQHYQDHHNKMSYLCAMENKRPTTVALKLLPLFLQQGNPQILQLNSGREFVVEVILREW